MQASGLIARTGEEPMLDIEAQVPSSSKTIPYWWNSLAKWRVLGRRGLSDQGKWGEVPLDVLLQIVSHLALEDLVSVHQVSRCWHQAVRLGTHVLQPARRFSNGLWRLTIDFPGVRVLYLRGHQLDEEQATWLGQCTRLEGLHLLQSSFAPGEAFLKLQRLKRLKVLEMVDVDGPSPWDLDGVLRELTGLERLLARKTQGGLKLPHLRGVTGLSRLKELQLMDMYHNHMLPGHTSLASLSSLSMLVLHRVGVTNGLLRAASQLTQLEVLDVRDSFQVTDDGLPFLAPLTRLRHLDLCCISQRRDEDLSNDAVAVMSRLSHLTSLNLSGHVGLSSEGLSFSSRLTRLLSLDLSGVPVWMGGAEFLQGLTGLTRLDMNRTLLGPPQLQVVSQLTNLRELGLASTLFDDDTVSCLAPLSGLTFLDIRYCPVHNSGASALLAQFPHLEVLLLEGCPVSTLKVLSIYWNHPSLRIWNKDSTRGEGPKWRSMWEMLMMMHMAPHQTQLRMLSQREDTVLLSVALALLVTLSFILYFSIIALLLLAVTVGPLAAVATLALLIVLCVVGVNYVVVFLKAVGRCFRWLCHCVTC
eukprot:jgi/Botrbrau1/3442/Bobra.139_1s0022.1